MIDAHQHFWRLDRGDYHWLTPALGAIHRDFGPRDLEPLLSRHRISRTIVVQAAPTVAETEYLLAIARDTPFVAGVVGWADLEAHDASVTIARLARDPLLVGLRPMVQDIADDDWLSKAALSPAFQALIEHDLVFDALVLPRHLPRLLRVVERHPSLNVVIDHGAKPRIGNESLDLWRSDLERVAGHAQVCCKLSGLLTEAPPGAGLAELRPVLNALIEVFGSNRVLWGSDWPVVELAGGYDRWRDITREALAPLDARARAQILGDNAARIYLSCRGRVR